ncbi:uncharacterized protein [Rutidosis leptorrhynchoides]|uniref:uncharacterized protein n=1 Tax=Rutidosis leptorrhynchoides TaxID=125765 RepID=UPI003A99B484
MSPKTAGSMRWHEESRMKDGRLRHPAYSLAWKTFDYENSEFSKEPRNVRLGLASDGFNPFGNMSVSHSTWPVVLMPYNLPPWLCMKKPVLFLSLLIPGPSAPVNTYHASTKSYFTLRASLLWTVSDLPAYANLSGWSTKGKLPCPSSHKESRSTRLSNSHKEIFMAHHRWLESLHPFRMDKDSFDGAEECEGPPRSLTGEQVLAELKGFEIKFGKLVKDNPSLPYNWKKINGKTKDHLKGRRDLEEMGIRHEIHPEPLSIGKVFLSPACFEMDKKEKEKFCNVLKEVKVPDGYAANISRCIQDFSPSFFDVMMHLSVHLASEARLGGPVHYRWMYPNEREHLNILSHQNPNKRKRDIQHLHSQEFEEWLSDYRENSRVILQALTSSFSSARDNDPIVGDVTYYGVLKDIIELQYGDEKKVVLFHCDWISSGSKIKVDENGFTTLDFRGLKQTKEPYILALQAQEVFYVADPVRKDWKVVIKTTPRDNFDIDEQICIDDVETHLQSDTPMGPQLVENETINMVRGDLDGAIIGNDTLVAATDKN